MELARPDLGSQHVLPLKLLHSVPLQYEAFGSGVLSPAHAPKPVVRSVCI